MTHPKISKAKARLLMQHPFFATLLIRTPVEVTNITPHGQPVELAATNGQAIFFNPEFLEECSVDDVMTVLAHEVGHDSLLHSLRLGARSHDLFNQAGDHAINLMLIDQGFKCPKSVPGGWLADVQYKSWSADKIYDDLRRKQKETPPKGGAGQGQNGKGGKPGPGKPGRDWLHGDVLPSPTAQDPASQAAAEQKAKQRVAAAANMARMAGKLTGELERMVGEFLDAKVHWTDVLRDQMLRVIKARDNWGRRNRRFENFYLPTRRSLAMGPICFIVDTSGSMNEEDLRKVCSEISHCALQTKPENIRVIWADARVKGEQVFSADEFAYEALKPVGGGGTCMVTALQHAEQYDPQVVILMTDGYFSHKDGYMPPYTLINLCSTSHPIPFGTTIEI